jgi:hypothetical protein
MLFQRLVILLLLQVGFDMRMPWLAPGLDGVLPLDVS